MILRFTFLLISFCSILNAESQIIVTDINNKAIPFVEVLSNNKYFYAQTNLNGELSPDELKKLDAGDTLFFLLISHERLAVPLKDLSPLG